MCTRSYSLENRPGSSQGVEDTPQILSVFLRTMFSLHFHHLLVVIVLYVCVTVCRYPLLSEASLYATCVQAKLFQSRLTLQPKGLWSSRLLWPWGSPGKNTGVGCHALLQRIFPTQGLNPSLLISCIGRHVLCY